jgi:hypothetical protein
MYRVARVRAGRRRAGVRSGPSTTRSSIDPGSRCSRTPCRTSGHPGHGAVRRPDRRSHGTRERRIAPRRPRWQSHGDTMVFTVPRPRAGSPAPACRRARGGEHVPTFDGTAAHDRPRRRQRPRAPDSRAIRVTTPASRVAAARLVYPTLGSTNGLARERACRSASCARRGRPHRARAYTVIIGRGRRGRR